MTVVVEAEFVDELNDKKSQLYEDYHKSFYNMIYAKYNTTVGFQSLIIIGFEKGSVECKYNVSCRGVKKETIINTYNATDWTKETLTLNGTDVSVNARKTRAEQQKDLTELRDAGICDLQNNCNPAYERCDSDNSGSIICSSKCTPDLCGDYGQCLLHPLGETRCICLPDTIFEHYSEGCLKASDYTNILALVGGVGGAVLIIIIVVIACVCKNRRKKKETTSNTRHNQVYGSEMSMPTRVKKLKANRAYNVGDRSDREQPMSGRDLMWASSEYERPGAYYNGWESINEYPAVPPRMYLPMTTRDSPRDYHSSEGHGQRRPQYVEPGDAYRSLDTDNQLYIRRPRLSTHHSDMFGYRERFV